MKQISKLKCEACRSDAPLVTEAQIKAMSPQIPGWEIIEQNGIKRLKRQYEFKNYMDGLDFTYKVGCLAEENGHHPEIITQYATVTVSWWSHAIKGLHVNDFVMAAKTDLL